MPLLLLFFISRWLSCHTLRWWNNFSSAVMSLSSLSRQTDLWDIRCLIIIWINTRLLCENDMCTVHCSVLIVCSWWWRSSTDMNKPEQKPSAVSCLVDLAAHLSTSQVCQFSVLWQQWKLLKKWYVSGEIAVFAEAVPSSLPGLPGFVREDLKLLTVSECRTCVLYFAGSRENEVDQVDKDYKVYKVN